MGLLSRTCAFGILLVAGCGDAVTRAELADVRHRLDEQSKRAAAAEHKLDELESRVFLLTDQVESQKVASLHRTPRSLPVVTLRPEPAPATTSVAASDEVEFEGAARSSEPQRARPTLRLDGTRPAVHRPVEPITLVRPNDGEVSDENLGVAPAPPISASASAAAPASERSAPAGEPLALYRAAYEDLRAGRHDAAARGFREFVRRFPHHDYADNAQYWLGEVFYDQKRYDEAAPQFRAVVTRWPTGNKAPDALVKLGFSLLALGRTAEARATLREVPSAYPRTEAARLAEERLASLLPTEGTK